MNPISVTNLLLLHRGTNSTSWMPPNYRPFQNDLKAIRRSQKSHREANIQDPRINFETFSYIQSNVWEIGHSKKSRFVR